MWNKLVSKYHSHYIQENKLFQRDLKFIGSPNLTQPHLKKVVQSEFCCTKYMCFYWSGMINEAYIVYLVEFWYLLKLKMRILLRRESKHIYILIIW